MPFALFQGPGGPGTPTFLRMENIVDYGKTLNLPKSAFPMKANLNKREPEMLAEWDEERLYHRIQEARRSADRFVLHDGPPYANGNIHIGTALNKILKDFVVKSKTMSGCLSPYIPGWDCHGLPIEHEVDKVLGPRKKEMSIAEIREECRRYAERFVSIQRDEFKRLGVLGAWESPYLTLHHGYEAQIVRELAIFVREGALYKGKKPIHWCAKCRTALAEAEVEYADHDSPSIYVKFPLRSDISAIAPEIAGDTVSVLIWTTTPWTIPANLAIAFHPDFDYVAVRARLPEPSGTEVLDTEVLILAEGLLHVTMNDIGIDDFEIVAHIDPKKLDGLACRHPFLDRDSVLILGDHVTLEAGTGCVHTAPGHGQEDYEIGLSYGLDIYTPVDDDGRFTEDVAFFAGRFVFDANDAVNDKIREAGALLGEQTVSHSYPHCWRCKEPIIFRATEQWFIRMDENELRSRSLECIDRVQWIPHWGKQRIYGMVENRPDWCISRQRSWGVPIVAFYCAGCGELLLEHEVLEHVADQFEQGGADLWFTREAADLLPPGRACAKCGGTDFRKESDILDVWFESGVSWAAVCERYPELTSPCDLYLEGSDQHRGWFNSALMTSVGTRGRAPYHTVLTHGFTVDGDGHKMAKSMGNVIAPHEIIDKYGADILRLWVAAEDYRDDIKISKEIIKRLVEAYRRIRNTCRYLIGNLKDYDPGRHTVEPDGMIEIDRWALSRLERLIERSRGAYESYEFHTIYHSLNQFCTVEMSAFYLDVLKDRLYTTPPNSPERRSAQTALYGILDGLVRLMAPILAFTAEEVWKHMPPCPDREQSVHLALFPEMNSARRDEGLEEKWDKLLEVRGQVTRALEIARRHGAIGHPLDACVEISAPGELAGFIESYKEDLPMIFKVSEVTFGPADSAEAVESEEIPGLRIAVTASRGTKCERCWILSETVGESEEHPTVCGRCADILAELE